MGKYHHVGYEIVIDGNLYKICSICWMLGHTKIIHPEKDVCDFCQKAEELLKPWKY